MQRRDDKCDAAEHRVLEQIGCNRAALAQQGLQAGITGKRNLGKLDGKIAQVKRIADGNKADDQQKLHLIGCQPERFLLHAANMVANAGSDNPLCVSSKNLLQETA